ncbi:hypothetical protein H0H93_008587, partial [Arthromyces matolae]
MLTFSKLATLALIAGLVSSVVEAAPMSPIAEGGSLLSARAPKNKAGCAAKHKTKT